MKIFFVLFASIFIFASFVNIPEYFELCHWNPCPDYSPISIVTLYPNFYNMHDPCGEQPAFGCYRVGWKFGMLVNDGLFALISALVIFGILRIIHKIKRNE